MAEIEAAVSGMDMAALFVFVFFSCSFRQSCIWTTRLAVRQPRRHQPLRRVERASMGECGRARERERRS